MRTTCIFPFTLYATQKVQEQLEQLAAQKITVKKMEDVITLLNEEKTNASNGHDVQIANLEMVHLKQINKILEEKTTWMVKSVYYRNYTQNLSQKLLEEKCNSKKLKTLLERNKTEQEHKSF